MKSGSLKKCNENKDYDIFQWKNKKLTLFNIEL